MAVCTGFEPVICSVTGNRGRPDSSNRPLVAGTGIEPACVAYETTEEPLLNPASMWSGRRDFNPRSPVPETGALSTRPLPVKLVGMRGFEPPPPCPQDRWAAVTLHPENLERLAGIEPVVESLEDSYSAIELQPRHLPMPPFVQPEQVGISIGDLAPYMAHSNRENAQVH